MPEADAIYWKSQYQTLLTAYNELLAAKGGVGADVAYWEVFGANGAPCYHPYSRKTDAEGIIAYHAENGGELMTMGPLYRHPPNTTDAIDQWREVGSDLWVDGTPTERDIEQHVRGLVKRTLYTRPAEGSEVRS